MRGVRLFAALVGALAVVLAAGVRPAPAQPAKDNAAAAPQELSETELAKIETTAKRMPTNFGNLALSDVQKKKITAIRKTNLRKIRLLEREIEILKKKEMEEVEGVLTSIQRELLKNLREGDLDGKKGEAKGGEG
jgi:hypothetical protein